MSDPNAVVSVVVDGRFYFSATAMDAAQFFVLRSRMAAALNSKVSGKNL